MFRKTTLILFPLLILLALLGSSHLAARTSPPSDPLPIRLQVATFDPLAGEPDIPAGQRLAIQADRPTTYLVQFTGPVRDEWKAAVEKAGGRLYGYIPDHAFIARMDPATVRSVQGLPFVRWVGPYHPAYRLATAFQTSKVSEALEVLVTVQTLPDADLDALAAQVQAWGGEVLGQAANAIAGYLRASLSTDLLTGLAAQDGVLWVEPYFEPQLLNDVGGGTIMRAAEIRTSLGLYGSGQTVAVADTGLDVGTTDSTMSDDFEGRIVAGQAICSLFTGGRTTWSDFHAHGTHVAGSVLGSGQNSGSTPSTHQYSGSFAGVAPEAQLIFQSIDNSPAAGLECIPPDFSTYLFGTAYVLGARIHTNSWGGPTGGTTENPEFGGYDTSSQIADTGTWYNKDLLVLFAAGNDGADANSNGVVDADSLGSPGTAKNVLTVGASENVRTSGGYNPGGICDSWGNCYPSDFGQDPIASDSLSNSADGMAAFSSRGPTDDGRVKPDIVAPGTNIISARSHDPGAGTGWGVYDQHYVYMGGTSMATPLTAGAAALVREWLTTVRAISNPSAAMMKAVLINGAADMSPGQYGSGGTQEIPALRPNNVTGWGRVDLVESLDPPDPRGIWLMDNTTGLSTGSSVVYTLTVGVSPTLRLREEEGTTGVTSPQGTEQLLQNGNFDTGAWTPWQTAGSPVLTNTVYRSASYSARLGGINDTHDYVYQEVTMPSDATEATLDFWYRVSGDDTDPDESLCMEILDSGLTTVLAGDCLPLYLEPQDQWLNSQLVITGTELTPLLGQTVYVAFSVLTNATNPSTAWVDDASFKVTTPGPLRITLAWTDYPAEPAAAPALVNNLSLEVIAPGGTHYYGNEGVYAGADPCLQGGQWDGCNNVEGVIIPGAPDGTYTVIVWGYNVAQGGSQPFALVASGDDLQGPAPEPGPTTVYLPLVLSNYDSSQLLRNGGFYTGTWEPWQILGSPELTDQQYNSAPYSARLGGYNGAVDYVSQEVTVPSNATEVTLDFWYRVSGDDPDPEEVLCYEILGNEFDVPVLAGGCNALYELTQNQWLNDWQVVLSGTDLAPLLGQTVFVTLDVFTNATNPGTAWVDDVSFRVTGTGP